MKLITSFMNGNIPLLLRCQFISSYLNTLRKEGITGKGADFGSDSCTVQQTQQYSEGRSSKRNVLYRDSLFYDASC
jgi:hypothetical protein